MTSMRIQTSPTALGILLVGLLLAAAGGAVAQTPPAAASPPPGPTAIQFPPATEPAALAPAPAPAPAAAAPAPAAAAAPAPAAAAPTPPVAEGVAAEGNISLVAFTSIVACAPVNLVVTPLPAPSTTYSASLDAEAPVRLAITFTVSNNTLYIGTNRTFATSEPVKLNITMPATALDGVTALGAPAVVISPGFTGQTLALVADGVSSVLARSVNFSAVSVNATGTDQVFAAGTIATATVHATGTSKVTLSGVTEGVTGSASGIVQLYVDPATGDVPIKVDAEGISKVFYTRGKCEAQSESALNLPWVTINLGLSGCIQTRPESFPAYAPRWSCGIRVRGNAVCGPDVVSGEGSSSSASASSSNNNDDTISVVSATGAGSTQASAAASSSSNFATGQDDNDDDEDNIVISRWKGGHVYIPGSGSRASSTTRGGKTLRVESIDCDAAPASLRMRPQDRR